MDKDKTPRPTGPQTQTGDSDSAPDAAADRDLPAPVPPAEQSPSAEKPLSAEKPPSVEQPQSAEPAVASPKPPRAKDAERDQAATSKKPISDAARASATGRPPGGQGSGKRGLGKWLILLVVLALAAGGYHLWPSHGDRLTDLLQGLVAGDPREPVATREAPPPASPREGRVDLAAETREAPPPAAANDDGLRFLEDRLDEEIAERQAQAAELRDLVAELQLQLNSHGDRLRRLSTTSREDWLLAEAEYLLRLASQRILTERQTANAVALMESADAILRDMNDPALYPVRKALADDITRVRMIEPIDRDGIYLRLGTLVDRVDGLDSPLPAPSAAPPPATDAAAPDTWQARLWANARRALANMASLIRIERRDAPLQPLLTLEQEQTLRHNLRVVLEQARLALLREEQVIYSDSLTRATTWVEDHFADNARRQVFLQELELLARQPVSQDLPSVTPSLRALQEYIRLWHNRFDGGDAGHEEPGPQDDDGADGDVEPSRNDGAVEDDDAPGEDDLS